MKGQPAIDARRERQHRADGYCNQAGKLKYRTRKKALKAPSPDGVRSEAYECRFCGLWHNATARGGP